MKRALGWVGAFVLLAVPAPAAAEVSIGYSFLQYLEEGGGNAPLGFYMSLAGRGRSVIELDFGYHRDTEQVVVGAQVFETKLQSFTGLLGFKIGRDQSRGSAQPFFHILGGMRRDRLSITGLETSSGTSWGGMTGLGVDLKAGESFAIRLGADFQIFFDRVRDAAGTETTDKLKTLRFSAGFTF